jgi:tRNA pseudouridine(55) synthase
MASGKLLVLVGDECKKQEKYHGLDKEYRVEMLLGIASDTGDVLGTISECAQKILTLEDIQSVCTALTGKITLSYPHFSAKTVRGKPLHTWTLEGRLDEIEIPQKTSRIYRLHVDESRIVRKDDLVADVRKKIETIPPVTDPRKHLGADFRRADVRASWTQLEHEGLLTYQIVTFTCIASSGTYMRSLCEHIARKLGTCALAYSIHRTTIGTYMPIGRRHGFWAKKY